MRLVGAEITHVPAVALGTLPTPRDFPRHITDQTVEVREEGNGRIKGITRMVNRMWHGGGGPWTDPGRQNRS